MWTWLFFQVNFHSEITGSCSKCAFNFVRSYKTIFQSYHTILDSHSKLEELHLLHVLIKYLVGQFYIGFSHFNKYVLVSHCCYLYYFHFPKKTECLPLLWRWNWYSFHSLCSEYMPEVSSYCFWLFSYWKTWHKF